MSDVIERLADVLSGGTLKTLPVDKIEAKALRKWPCETQDEFRDTVRLVLSELRLTPSTAASLAEGRGVVVPRIPSDEMMMEGVRSATEGGPPPSDVYAQEFLGELAKMYRAMVAASQSNEGEG